MKDAEKLGRPNQRRRTRKDLLEAAALLMKQGKRPSLEEVAQAALVSRATAYRYFPNVEQLLIEAPLDVAIPAADEVFRNAPPSDPLARVERVDDAFAKMMAENETQLRLLLVQTLERSVQVNEDLPLRQNRRMPLIEEALAPAKKTLKDVDELAKALALVIGTEAMVVFKDVLQVDEAEAKRIRRWAIKALVEAAKK